MKKVLIVLFAALLLCSACQSAPAAEPTPEATPTPKPIPTMRPIEKPTPRPTLEPTPTPEAMPRAVTLRYYHRVQGGWLNYEAPAELQPLLEELVLAETQTVTQVNGKYATHSYFYGTEIKLVYPEGNYLLRRAQTGEWVLQTGSKLDGDDMIISYKPVAEETARQILVFMQQQTGWEWNTLCDIKDITQARLEVPGRKAVVIKGSKATQLEKLFSGAVYRGGLNFKPGPKLHLTRKDGNVITVYLNADTEDIFMMQPFGCYDYGPGDEQNAWKDLQEIFGIAAWDVEDLPNIEGDPWK